LTYRKPTLSNTAGSLGKWGTVVDNKLRRTDFPLQNTDREKRWKDKDDETYEKSFLVKPKGIA
jgi:hypothetical protein